MHQRAPADVVRYVQTGWSVHFYIIVSSQILLETFFDIFEGGVAKPWYFTALEAPLPINSIAAVGLRFWVSWENRSKGSRRSCAVCFLDLCIANLAYLDISKLKSGIRRTPPHPRWKPKKYVGRVYFMWSGEICLRNFLTYTPPKYSRVEGGDSLTIFYVNVCLSIYLFLHPSILARIVKIVSGQKTYATFHL